MSTRQRLRRTGRQVGGVIAADKIIGAAWSTRKRLGNAPQVRSRLL